MPFKDFSNCERYSLSCTFDIFSNNKKFNGMSELRSNGLISGFSNFKLEPNLT
jgi:hypothetical protein